MRSIAKIIFAMFVLTLASSLSSAYYGYQDYPITYISHSNDRDYDYIIVEKRTLYYDEYPGRTFHDYPSYSKLRAYRIDDRNYNRMHHRDYVYGLYEVYDTNWRYRKDYSPRNYPISDDEYRSPYYYSPVYDWHLEVYNWRY